MQHWRWNLAGGSALRTLLSAALVAACGEPATERVADAPPPVITATTHGRAVHNPGASERFLPREGVPSRPTFLFSSVVAASRDAAGNQAVLPPEGDRLLLFDPGGRFVRAVGGGDLARAIAVAPARDGWLVVERDGDVLAVNGGTGWTVEQSPLAYAGASDPAGAAFSFGIATITRFGDGFIAARSAFASANTPEPSGAPLLLELTSSGAVAATIDTTIRLGDATLTTIANSGHLAANDSLLFFAYLTRDEIRAYDRAGRRRWTADRGMRWPTAPSRETGSSQRELSFSPVNLSIAAHGDFVYVLAYADSTMRTTRIDAFDAATGVLARSVRLPASAVLITLDPEGALWHAPADTLSVIAAPPETVIIDFTLPTPQGDSLRLSSLRGKVVLLNVWASWCGPCRDEFPLMAQLARELSAEEFAVVAVSDDMDEGAARRFVAEFEPPFAIGFARGALEPTLNYRGLPYTVLLDREGRVIQRYIGFGGPEQFERLRSDIMNALRDSRRRQSAPSPG